MVSETINPKIHTNEAEYIWVQQRKRSETNIKQKMLWKQQRNLRWSALTTKIIPTFFCPFRFISSSHKQIIRTIDPRLLIDALHIQWITNKDLLSKHTASDPRAYQSPSAILTSQCLDPIGLYIWALLLLWLTKKVWWLYFLKVKSFQVPLPFKSLIPVKTLATFKEWNVLMYFHQFRLEWHFDTVPLSVYVSVYLSVWANLLILSNIWTCLGEPSQNVVN